jgi:hypothetical protein
MLSKRFTLPFAGAVLMLAVASVPGVRATGGAFAQGVASGLGFGSYTWTEITANAQWTPRAGLQVVELGGRFFLMGGRTPINPAISPVPGASTIWGDVWTSRDHGATWTRLLADAEAAGYWPRRAYFQAVTRANEMYVLGGQNFVVEPNPCLPGVPGCPPFVSRSDFFNDVWRSRDGATWEQMTGSARWEGRAGLSAIVFGNDIYVMGGSKNDDSSVVGGPPARVYFNDVWKSRDGREWELLTAAAPWAPRAGAVVVEKNGWIYLLGGEEGFTCDDPTKPCPPYFNDVWRSRDGAKWEIVTANAGWSPRPGHQCAVLLDTIACFGGFGLPPSPFAPSANPSDVWVSKDGASWQLASDSPWNASSSDDIKYDFDVLVVQGGAGGNRPSIYTFGGDRETFNFTDPVNYLRVDNDVWRFAPPAGR